MKNALILCGVLMWASLSTVQAQKLSKEEKKIEKEWKKRQKKMSAEEFKALVESREILQQRKQEMESESLEFRNQLSSREAELATLKAKRDQLEKANASAPKKEKEVGLSYKVQIGAYRELDISYQANDKTDLRAEEYEGVKRYTLGRFKTLDEAEAFRRHIRKMGVKDAFIVGYRDGVRDDSLVPVD
jgi:chromosome segregation ATPase